jgi:hypothetical protein
MTKEMDDLRAENNALQARVTALEARANRPVQIAPVRKAEDVGARIVTLAPAANILLPPSEEIGKIGRMILTRYPVLGPDLSMARTAEENKQDWATQYEASFRTLVLFPRTDTLDTKHAPSVWIDRIAAVLRSQHLSARITLPPMMAAVLAWGDIPHSFDPRRFPYDICLGLAGIGGSGRDADAASWQRVLATGALRPATRLDGADASRTRTG